MDQLIAGNAPADPLFIPRLGEIAVMLVPALIVLALLVAVLLVYLLRRNTSTSDQNDATTQDTEGKHEVSTRG